MPMNAGDQKNNQSSHYKRQSVEPLFGNNNKLLFAYLGQAFVGTPAQNFSVLFDTGSYQMWIKSIDCKSSGCSAGSQLNGSLSSTFKNLGTIAPPISYVDGTSVNGVFIQDTVKVSNVTLEEFNFISAEQVSGASHFDGIVGLGFRQSSGMKSFFEEAISQKDVIAPIFSYYIDSTDNVGGITFGAIDTMRFAGQLAWQSVVDSPLPPIYWTLPLSRVNANGKDISLSGSFFAIVDTGSSLTLAPTDMAEKINLGLGLTLLQPGVYGIPCPGKKIPDNLPNLNFTMGNVELFFKARDYLFTFTAGNGQDYCISGIAGLFDNKSAGSSNSIVLGNVFLRRYYTVFDYGNRKVGFATANRSPSVNSAFSISDSKSSPNGKADPSSVNFETGSFSNSTSGIPTARYGMLFIGSLLIVTLF